MLPLIHPHDKPLPQPPHNLSPNDIVLFSHNSRLILHRLLYIHPHRNLYITKGDNNRYPDPPLTQSQIIGKVNQLQRNTQTISLSHLYLSQSTLYLSHLTRITHLLTKHSLPHLFLKGLPIHLYINNAPPHHIYADTDILIHPCHFSQVKNLLTSLGFSPLPTPPQATQINFVKQTSFLPIIIDLHLQPAISFTKIPSLARLTPTQSLTSYLFSHTQTFTYQQTSFPILTNEALLIYLLLHLFHHTFQGYHRFQLIHDLITKKTLSWPTFQQDVHRLHYPNIIFVSLSLLQHLYATPIPHLSFHPNLSSRLTLKLLTTLPLTYFFTVPTRRQAAFLRLLFTLLLSPLSLSKKLLTLISPTTLSEIITNF